METPYTWEEIFEISESEEKSRALYAEHGRAAVLALKIACHIYNYKRQPAWANHGICYALVGRIECGTCNCDSWAYLVESYRKALNNEIR